MLHGVLSAALHSKSFEVDSRGTGRIRPNLRRGVGNYSPEQAGTEDKVFKHDKGTTSFFFWERDR